MVYKRNYLHKICWITLSVILLIVFSIINKPLLQKVGLFLGAMSIIVSMNILWKWMGWKTLLTIISISLVDIDHFIFKSKGFFEHPENTIKILHAFHSIEMIIFVILINRLV